MEEIPPDGARTIYTIPPCSRPKTITASSIGVVPADLGGGASISLIQHNERYAFLVSYPAPPAGWLKPPPGGRGASGTARSNPKPTLKTPPDHATSSVISLSSFARAALACADPRVFKNLCPSLSSCRGPRIAGSASPYKKIRLLPIHGKTPIRYPICMGNETCLMTILPQVSANLGCDRRAVSTGLEKRGRGFEVQACWFWEVAVTADCKCT
jgi:hypothetical protein